MLSEVDDRSDSIVEEGWKEGQKEEWTIRKEEERVR